MEDLFDAYRIGVRNLTYRLHQDTPHYLQALDLEKRLLDNLNKASSVGDSEETRQDRMLIVDELNRLAMETTGFGFYDYTLL